MKNRICIRILYWRAILFFFKYPKDCIVYWVNNSIEFIILAIVWKTKAYRMNRTAIFIMEEKNDKTCDFDFTVFHLFFIYIFYLFSSLFIFQESELFMELIRDVANELDIDVLCYKILKNVSILTHADRGSLFLARNSGEERFLVAKLFDVRHDTSFEEAVKMGRHENIIKIPFGVGIAGTVAQSKALINIKDAYKVSAKFVKLVESSGVVCCNRGVTR